MGLLSRFSHRIVSRKADAMMLHAGDLVGVVSKSYRQDALQRVAAVATDSGPFLENLTGAALETAKEDHERRWFRAVLMRERDKRHDPNAVAVFADGDGLIGYFSRGDAIDYWPVFDALKGRRLAFAACPAFLIGGAQGKPYSVMLCLSSPERVVAALADEP
jgi:hypothetical protein